MKMSILRAMALATSLVGAMSYAAHASTPAPENSFYPADVWQVGSVGEEERHCAIQNKFNNGFIMRLNGTKLGVQSVQVDFRQRVFEDGQNYQVKVNVPDYFNSSVNAVTEGGNGLSLDVTDQKEFYNAIKTAGVFDMDIEGNAFRFYMTGFGTQANHFEDCLSGTEFTRIAERTETATPVSEAAAQEVVAEEPVQVIAQNDVIDEELEHLIEDMVVEMELESSEAQESAAEPEEAVEEPSAEEVKPEPVDEQKAVAPTEPVALPESTVPAPAPVSTAPAPVEKTYRSPEIKVTTEQSSATLDFRGNTPDIKDRKAFRSYQQELIKLQEENRKLKEAVAQKEIAAQERVQSISSNNWNLEQATMRYNEADRQLKALGRQIQRERTACTMEKRELESMLFDPALTNEKQLAHLAELEAELEDARAEIQSLRALASAVQQQ